MLPFKLCKQLKQAGFWDGKSLGSGEAFMDEENYAPHPSLSDLIESCGDKFGLLKRVDKKHHNSWEFDTDVVWSAQAFDKNLIMIIDTTPDSAVAKLWLELNKKDKFANIEAW